ncbi:MAG TPA: zf-TFIIB domain-containing protein [Pyrinomonadaceae bacterium]|nr:zf-TFIIB domain-containing protein [Pyrinomonadaceae bacterium]
MNCPVCTNVNLVMSERQGIEIDYCPQCRGVWLDRGELDKMIERSVAGSPGRRPDNEKREHSDDYRPSDQYREPHREGHYKKKKREGFLSDLFDFD